MCHANPPVWSFVDHSLRQTHNTSKQRVSSYMLMSRNVHWRISEQMRLLISSGAWIRPDWCNWLVFSNAHILVRLVLACTVCLWIQLKSGKNIYIYFFYFLKAFLSLNRDKYFSLFWCFCVRISFILLLVKWSDESECEPTGLGWLLTKPTTILFRSIMKCSSHNFVDLSCVNLHSWV